MVIFSLRSSDKKPSRTAKLAFDRKSRLMAQSKDTYCLLRMMVLFSISKKAVIIGSPVIQ